VGCGWSSLLVVDERRRLVHRAELRNADSKIVVWLDVDEPAAGGAAPPPLVTVRPLRSYQKEADRAWRLVTTLLEPATEEPVAPRAASPSVADPESPARALLAAELTDSSRRCATTSRARSATLTPSSSTTSG
jgi:hypothetical protein